MNIPRKRRYPLRPFPMVLTVNTRTMPTDRELDEWMRKVRGVRSLAGDEGPELVHVKPPEEPTK